MKKEATWAFFEKQLEKGMIVSLSKFFLKKNKALIKTQIITTKYYNINNLTC